MRGKLAVRFLISEGLRITPAHAGKTNLTLTEIQLCKDHPRACGENASPNQFYKPTPGSPPRMRGKQLFLTEY